MGAVSYDVMSMYPTMINIHNISTETVNCNCCRDNPQYVNDDVMKEINNYLLSDDNESKKREPREWHYWICRRRGKLADVMKSLMERKVTAKKSGQKLQEKAIKIFMNSGYGCFGQAYFAYQDPRVAELTTAYGRCTLKTLEKFVGGKDNVLYGDTDSLYLPSENDAIITEAD